MKRTLVLLSLLAAVPALAQSTREETKLRIHVAYGFTSSFRKDGGGSARMEGPELGVAIPIGTFLKDDLLLEPSFFGGGRLRKGGDDDADVYRLTLFAHRTFARGVGVRAGLGYAVSTQARGGNFDGESSIIFDLGGEIPFSQKLLKGFSPYVDVHAIFGKAQVSGAFFGIGTRL